MTAEDSIAPAKPYHSLLETNLYPKNFFIRVQNHLQKIRLEDIHWIHADGNYCYLHLGTKKFALKSSLRKLLRRLPSGHFVRIHKSYVVRLQNIDRIEVQDSQVLINGAQLPIGRTFRSTLMERIDVL